MRECINKWLAAAVLLCAATVAHSQAMVHTATATGSYAGKIDFTVCGIGPCQNFTLAMGASGSFNTAAPLAPNLAAANIAPLMTSFSFTDGITTYSSANPAVRILVATVSTNGAGAITASDIRVQRWHTGVVPHGAGDRLSMVEIGATGSGDNNAPCINVGVSPAGTPDSCVLIGGDAGRSIAFNSARVWASAPLLAAAPAAIPTLSEWGLVLMAALMGLAAVVTLRRGFRPR